MQNSEYFDEALRWFKDASLQEFAFKYVDLFPPYFAEKPASSTGKYHAGWSNAKGGLRAHTLMVAWWVNQLSEAYMLNDLEHDGALIAALGHDAIKYGFQGGNFTTKTHESEGALFFKRVVDKFRITDFPLFAEIYEAIAFHQGRWAVSETPKNFPQDFGKLAQIVHIADMNASRKGVRYDILEPPSLIG